jgi:hypothetical protein
MPSDRFAVYEGRRERDPRRVVRVVGPDGRAVHVIHEDAMRLDADVSFMPLERAIREAFRLAGRPLLDECE